MQPIDDVEADNLIYASYKEGRINVLSPGQNMNLTEDFMDIICCIIIIIDYYNDPAPENFPAHKQQQQGQ